MSFPRVSGSVAGLSVVFLLLSGCFSANLGMPDQWPQSRSSDNPCRDVAGTYINLGEVSPGVSWRANLADALTVQAHIAKTVLSHLHLETPPGLMPPCKECITELRWLDSELKQLQLTVRNFDDGESIVRTLSASKRDFSCSDAGLEVTYSLVYERVLAATYLRGARVFTATSDGSLTMSETATSFLRMAAFLPLGTDATFSARWMPHRERPVEDIEKLRTKAPAAQVAPSVSAVATEPGSGNPETEGDKPWPNPRIHAPEN